MSNGGADLVADSNPLSFIFTSSVETIVIWKDIYNIFGQLKYDV